ncbi:hypothetical protein Tco_1330206 [Tanacetum coccineum]
MNPQETQQVAARDEKWVPSLRELRLALPMLDWKPQCHKRKRHFKWTILDICPRVEGVNFTDVPDDNTTLAFLIKLGYKGPLYKHTNMFVDHMHHPWRTLEAIIIKCLYGKTDDGIVSRLKFVRIGEDYQEYGLAILEVMLNEAIKQSESYQMFIKYTTGQIPPKKSRGKGSQRKKTIDDSQETVNVFEESEPEPESVKRKTSSKRRVKKKVTLFADENIIYDDPDTALVLGKSISKTEAEEAEAARQLKGVPSLTPEEQEAAYIMQALKETKKTSKRHPNTRALSEETGTIPGVTDESTVVSATSSEGTGTKPGVPDEEKDITEENVFLEWGLEQESEYSEEDKLDDKEKDDKEGSVGRVLEGEVAAASNNQQGGDKATLGGQGMKGDVNAEVEDSNKGDEEVTDTAKADAEKTSKVKVDAKKTKLPPTSSTLSVSLGFGDQFLKLSSDSSLVSTVKDTTNAEINSLLEVKIQSKVPYI